MVVFSWHAKVLLLLGFALISLAALLLVLPMAQDQSYHHFADGRELLGIANFWNVVSNLPFLLIGAAGLRLRGPLSTRILFLGIFLVAFGSAYYHLQPGDDRLIWDRLPITIAFMAIFANAIEERLSRRAGTILLWALLALGVVSLAVWQVTGDLRLYAWVQFFPVLGLLVLFALFPGPRGASYWLVAIGLYAVAKAFELLDASLFAAGQVVSGHTLKHLFAAAACLCVFSYFRAQQPAHGRSA